MRSLAGTAHGHIAHADGGDISLADLLESVVIHEMSALQRSPIWEKQNLVNHKL